MIFTWFTGQIQRRPLCWSLASTDWSPKTWLHQNLGVSNLPEHIDRIERETGVLPVVNHRMHPISKKTQRAYHEEKGILPILVTFVRANEKIDKSVLENEDQSSSC